MSIRSAILSAGAAAAIAATPAVAFEATLTTECRPDGVRVTVAIVDPTPPNWGSAVGYTVLREVMGVCEDWTVLTSGPVAFDEGIDLLDQPAYPDLANWYSVMVMDADGNVDGYTFGYGSIDVANCRGAPVIRGRVVSGGVYWAGILPCEGMCWVPERFLMWGILGVFTGGPVAPYMGTDTVLDVYGQIGYWWEGPFVVVDHVVVTTCDAVPVTPTSWSTLKQRFR